MDPSESLQLGLDAIDHFSKTFGEFGRGIVSLGKAIKQTASAIVSGGASMSAAIASAGESLTHFWSSAQNAAQGAWDLLRAWAALVKSALSLGAAVGVAVVGGLAAATRQSIDFESAMLRVGGVIGKRMEEMGQLQATIRETAKTSTFRPGEIAAGGAFSLASFGFNEQQIAGMTKGVTMLAESLGADFGQAAELTARMLMVWNAPAEDATRVANMLATANAKTAATFDRLYYAMTKAGPVGKMVGMSMEEVVASIGMLNNAGLEGEAAGSAFRMMISNLSKPTAEATTLLTLLGKQVGLTTREFNPAAVSFERAMRSFEMLKKRGLLGPTELFTITSRTGMLALNAILEQGVDAWSKLTREITGTNQAFQQQQIMTSGVAGQWKFLLSSLEELSIALTEKMRGPLADVLRSVSAFVNALAGSPQVAAFANALGNLARRLQQFVTANLVQILKDFPNHWEGMVKAVTGYMRRVAQVLSVAWAFIQFLFAGGGRNVRRLWSELWDWIVGSLATATSFVAGGIGALAKLIDNALDNVNRRATVWGQGFIEIVAEVMRQVIIVAAEMGASAAEEFQRSLGPIGQEVLMFLAPQAGLGLDLIRSSLRNVSGVFGSMDTSSSVAQAQKSVGSVIERISQRASQQSPVVKDVMQAFQAGRGDFEKLLRGEMTGFTSPGTGGLGLSKWMFEGIDQFERDALNLSRRVGETFGKATGGGGKLPAATTGTEDVEDLADKMARFDEAVKEAGKAAKEGWADLQKAFTDPTFLLGQQLEASRRSIDALRQADEDQTEAMQEGIRQYQRYADRWFGGQAVGGNLMAMARAQKALEIAGGKSPLELSAYGGASVGAMTYEQARALAASSPAIRAQAQGAMYGIPLDEIRRLAQQYQEEQVVGPRVRAAQERAAAFEDWARYREAEAEQSARVIDAKRQEAEASLKLAEFLGQVRGYLTARATLEFAGKAVGPRPPGMAEGAQAMAWALMQGVYAAQQARAYEESRVGAMAGVGQPSSMGRQ